ncbi:MAG TPA: ATP-binding protein [Chitinophagaceae bacterium]|nr:ATP-binding protein [Chitinophagaceae bacterium]
MKKLALIIIAFQFFSFTEAQKYSENPDSLKLLLSSAKHDTDKVLLLADLGYTCAFLQVDTGIVYAQRAISLARQLNFKKGEAAAMSSYGWAFWASGNYDKAAEMALKSLNLYKSLQDREMIPALYNQLAVIYRDVGDYQQGLKYCFLSKNLFGSPNEPNEVFITIGSIYLLTNEIDSASLYLNKLNKYYEELQKEGYQNENAYLKYSLGVVEAKKKHYEQALNYYRASIPTGNNLDIVYTYNHMARLYQETGNIDSSIYYSKEILNKRPFLFFQRGVLDAMTILAQDYKLKNQNDSAIKYLESSIALNNSLFNKEKTRAIQSLTFNEQLRQQEIEAAKIKYQNQVKMYIMLASLIIFLLIAFILWLNNRRKQKVNILLQYQKEEIQRTLTELKSTQAQLIQSEKMASLGELTAGIAHEIQNPLNFVNNFSEVNDELLKELATEADKGNLDEVKAIAKDITFNSEKINHHGKRADAIVKGMLQHSRSNSGQKEPTDINALADEYLRLAYHGLRAKDKSFNAITKTDFDSKIGKINIMPQDIGRVILNLINNAFYAVDEKKKQTDEGYEPTVSVSTKKANGRVEIKVADNGNGIPQNVLDKIFQPFFTTKPTGQGTGLGLSLSYDIVKAHGGELKVETKEGEGTEFIIILPA